MIETTGNRRYALWFSVLSLATSLLALSLMALFFMTDASFSPSGLISPVVLILAFAPLIGILGIISKNKEVLIFSSVISLALTILGIVSIGFLFVVPSLLLIISAFVYQYGIIGKFKREIADTRLKNIALVLAGVALVGAMFITLYSERVLVTDGCYEYQTSLTSGERICSDFRIDYMIPVIISAVGMAGILRDNKLLLYASATVAFLRIIVYLQPIASLFLPSFIVLIFSALIYKMGIRSVEPQAEGQENAKQYYLLLILSGIVIFWIIAVYIFVHPASIEMSGGYG